MQHREVQGQESPRSEQTLRDYLPFCPFAFPRFRAYFKRGVRYLAGGVRTGLSHYVEDTQPKLFQVSHTGWEASVPSLVLQVKGRRQPIVRQVSD